MPDYVRAVYTSVKNTWQDAENLDATHGYVTYIWIPEETFKVDKMKLHIYAEKFRAFSKTVKAGGGVTETSEEGGAHSHDVTGATSSEVTPSHTHQVTIGVKTSVAGGAHSHDVTGATSSASDTASFGAIVDSYAGLWAFGSNERTTGTPSGNEYFMLPTFKACPLDHANCQLDDYTAGYFPSKSHTHEIPALTPVLGPTVLIWDDWSAKTHKHTVSGQTAEAVANHQHNVDIGTPTSESGGGLHDHTVTGQTAEAVANHTHDVVLAAHTHEIDFGIYEEAIATRTLSAILYDPDGTELKDFGVVLTGEDSDILDLTDYFETLKYGMYKMVLSASGRLRARLVFYELCKMYAQF